MKMEFKKFIREYSSEILDGNSLEPDFLYLVYVFLERTLLHSTKSKTTVIHFNQSD